MYLESDNVNQNVQEQESSRETVSRKHEVELEIQVLEERIAPGGVIVDHDWAEAPRCQVVFARFCN